MTDADFLEVVLREHPNEWVSQREILNLSEQRRRCGMTVHSRVSDLRRRGHVIENRCERVGTRVVSYYRLVEPSLTAPPVSVKAATRAGIGGAVSEGSRHGEAPPSGTDAAPSLTLFETPRDLRPAWR
jgi:hypothetical protein